MAVTLNRVFFSLLLASLCGAAAAEEAPRVKLTTSLGDMVLELAPSKAPRSVKNFLRYVNDGHYDGTVFHRVIPNFMIQGGGFSADFERRETRAPILNEADNGLKNDRGTLAMARTGDPHSATGQFFINVVDNDFLNHRGKSPRGWGYAVFGRVVDGIEVMDRIKDTPTGPGGPFPGDVPSPIVIIKKAMQLPTEHTGK